MVAADIDISSSAVPPLDGQLSEMTQHGHQFTQHRR